jgi:hypothetical protein
MLPLRFLSLLVIALVPYLVAAVQSCFDSNDNQGLWIPDSVEFCDGYIVHEDDSQCTVDPGLQGSYYLES